MNPIGIFPPPTRALSRQNTKSGPSQNNSASAVSTSPLARFHTSHHARAESHAHAHAHANATNDDSAAAGGSAVHGRNKSHGSGASLAAGSSIWIPFSSSENTGNTAAAAAAAASTTTSSQPTSPNNGTAAGYTSSSSTGGASSSGGGGGGGPFSGPRKLLKKRTASAQITTTAAGLAAATGGPQSSPTAREQHAALVSPSTSSASNSTASLSPMGGMAAAGSPAAFMADSLLRTTYQQQHSSTVAAPAKRKPTPDIPRGLPQTIFFDRLRLNEVTAAHRLEVQGYPEEDAATLDKLRYRQAAAPHLFLGAFLPGTGKGGKGDHQSGKDSSNGGTGSSGAANSGSGGGGSSNSGSSSGAQPPRTLIGFITGTAAPALTLRAMSTHSNNKDARLVCIHSVVVAPEYQRKGLALRMLREYIGRLMRAEMGPRDARLAALAEAKANAAKNPAPAASGADGDDDGYKAPVAFADDDLLGDEDDEAEVENERSGDRQSRKRGYESIALLAHNEVVPLYERAGFHIQGLSHINYGSGDWLEMRRDIVPRSAMRRGDTDDDDDEDDDDEEEEEADTRVQGPGAGSSANAAAQALKATMTNDKPSVPLLVEPVRSSQLGSDITPRNTAAAALERETSTGEASTGAKSDGTGGADGDAASGNHSQGASDDSGGAAASPPILSLPASLNPAALLAALTRSGSRSASGSSTGNKSASNANTKNGTANQMSSPPSQQAPRNPGVPFSTVLGQALAGKTASEDPRSTLEARLVNREEDTNIADLYCPREACNCLLLRADLGVWKARELGPLCAPALQSSSGSMPANSPAPPLAGVVAPPPPRPSGADQHTSPLIFAAGSAAAPPPQQQQPQQQQQKISMQGATSLRDFWSVPSPFVFDNISFSKDVQWPPRPAPPSGGTTLSPSSSSAATALGGEPAGAKRAQALGGMRSPLTRGRSNSSSVGGSTSPEKEAGGGGGGGDPPRLLSPSSVPASPGVAAARERSHSASAVGVPDAGGLKSPSGGGEDEERRRQRALFAQGVAASSSSANVQQQQQQQQQQAVAAPPPPPPPPSGRGGTGAKIGGLKLTIGKRKNSLASGATLSASGLASPINQGSQPTTPGTAIPGSAVGGGVGNGAPPLSAAAKKAKEYGIDPHAYPFNTSSAFSSGSWHLSSASAAAAAAAAAAEAEAAAQNGPSLTIKYLLCPECDCGPLGYVVISEEMKGGGLARAVAASQGGREEGGGGGGTSGGAGPKRKMEYLLAADRVRYRFKAPM